MPILSMFPGGGGGSSGVPLPPVTNIIVQPASKKVYLKWTDPEDLVDGDTTYAEWAGTVVVRKAGSAPENRFDGTVVATSTTRNEYQNTWLVDESGLTNNTTYQYHIYPFSTGRVYTDDPSGVVSAKPVVTSPDSVENVVVAPAGNGKISIMWDDPEETKENDGVVLSRWDNTRVLVKTGSYPSYSATSVAYRGDFATRNSHSSTPLIINGLTNGTKYYIRIFTHNTDGGTKYVNGGTIVPDKLPISTVPSQKNAESLIYNGNNLTPEWNDYDANKLTLSVVAQKNAGTYTATFTPKEDYVWADGETDEEKSAPKTVDWTIQKAAGVLSVNPASVTLDADHTSVTATITKTFDGTIAVSSSDTTVATVTLSGDTVTISSVNDTSGDTIVTVSASGGGNYTVPADATISVSAVFAAVAYTDEKSGYTDGLSGLSAAELNDIAKAISNNSAITNTTSQVWVSRYNRHISIGDEITISMSWSNASGTPYVFRLMGFNHYSLTSSNAYGEPTSSRKAGMLFQAKTYINAAKTLSSQAGEDVNWTSGQAYSFLSTTIYPSVQDVFKNVLKKCTVDCNYGAYGNSSVAHACWMFIPSCVEIGYSGTEANTSVYAWYKANTGSANRKRSKEWWLRSPVTYDSRSESEYGYKVSTSGDVVSTPTYSPSMDSFTACLVPCFCI